MCDLSRPYDRRLQFRVDDRDGGFTGPPKLDIVGELTIREGDERLRGAR